MNLPDRLEIHAQWAGHMRMDSLSVDLMLAAIELRKHLPKCDLGEPLTDEKLKQMMQDPRYWKHRDPEWIERVRAGFAALHGED